MAHGSPPANVSGQDHFFESLRSRARAAKEARPEDSLAQVSPDTDFTELVFAFARAQGTVLDPIRAMLGDALGAAGFLVPVPELSLDALLWNKVMGTVYEEQPNHERELKALELADQLRVRREQPDALMQLGLAHIETLRQEKLDAARSQRCRGVAWIVSHLVHPDEVHLLRRHFGSRAFLIAVFESLTDRRTTLIERYRRKARNVRLSQAEAEDRANDILAKSAGLVPSCAEVEPPEAARFRPDLQRTFPLADLFLNVREEALVTVRPGKQEVRKGLDQRSTAKLHHLVAQIVGHPFSTPDSHEAGMAYAYQARVSSASLGRQVGAALVSERGDLIATGWNEVPAPKGGVYRQHYANLDFLTREFGLEALVKTVPDFRDHMLTGTDSSPAAGDSNSRIRYRILADLLDRLDSLKVLDTDGLNDLVAEYPGLGDAAAALENEGADGFSPEGRPSADARAWAAAILTDPIIKKAAFTAMLEYGRSVHAEMNAITTAARLGLPVRGSTLYSTTFPCHECARHIVAAGIDRVVYIEPFPKSRVFELHGDAVTSDDDTETEWEGVEYEKIQFVPFIGISPWRHEELFAMGAMVYRKKADQKESSKDASLTGPDDLWAVAEWDLRTGRLRPAFRMPTAVEPVEEILAQGGRRSDELERSATE